MAEWTAPGASSSASLGERLRSARRRRFVGRTGEVEMVKAALAAPESSFSVLYVYGPGGVGKTSLLDAFEDVASAAGSTVVRVDGRAVRLSSDGLLEAVAAAAGGGSDAFAAVAACDRPVLLLDTYEVLVPLDEWVREKFLIALPGDVHVVIAGRNPPDPRWVADPAWRDLLRVVSLRNLSPQDVREYLAVERVPAAHHEQLTAMTHGHPLTLSLLVDGFKRGGGDPLPASLLEVPDLVRALLAQVVDAAPSSRHRAALEVSAHARFTTEDLLRSVLGSDDAVELCGWLRMQSFMEEGPHGLFPHDLARDVLDADRRWRDPEGYVQLHRRVRTHIVEQIRGAGDERHKQRLVADVIFVARTHPSVHSYFAWPSGSQEYIDAVRPSDRPAILDMTKVHQGREQAELVLFWLDRQPQSFRVFRGPSGAPSGYAGLLALHEATDAELEADPGTRAMWNYAQQHGPPRRDEQVMAWRFFLDCERYHAPSTSRTLVAVWHVQDILTRQRCSWSFIGTYEDIESWDAAMSYLDFGRAAEADYTIGDHSFAVYAHDWRRLGVSEWLDVTAAREVGEPADPPHEHTADVVLSQPEFADAVRSALRDLHTAERLARNPLLRSRLVREHAGEQQPLTQALQALLDQAAKALHADPRKEPIFQVVDRTFLRPAPTHERAAEVLNLSFSTYRRYRDRGVERIVEWMWRREVYGPESGQQLDSDRPVN